MSTTEEQVALGNEIVAAAYESLMLASADYEVVTKMEHLVCCLSIFTTVGQMLALDCTDPKLIYGAFAQRFTELRDAAPGQEGVTRIDALTAALRAAIAVGNTWATEENLHAHHFDRRTLAACQAILDGGMDVAALDGTRSS